MRALAGVVLASSLLAMPLAAQEPTRAAAGEATRIELERAAQADVDGGRFARAAMNYTALYEAGGEPTALLSAGRAWLRVGSDGANKEAALVLRKFLELSPGAADRAEAERLLAKAEGRAPAAPDPEPAPRIAPPPPAPLRAPPPPPPPRGPHRRRKNGFFVPGVIMTTMGSILGGVSLFFLAEMARPQNCDRQPAYECDDGGVPFFFAWVLGTIGGSHLAVGVPMLVVGARGEEVDGDDQPIRRALTIEPVIGPTQWGLRGSF